MKRFFVLTLSIAFAIILAGCNQGHPQEQPPISTELEITTAAVPWSSADCVDKDYQIRASELAEAGFLSIAAETIDDLTSSQKERVGCIESISIDGSTSFAQGQTFDKESPVIIRYHDYRNCTLAVHVDFSSNLLFNRYDVRFSADGHTVGTMEHGTDSDFELLVKAGTHTFSFVNDDSSSVKGTATFTVDGDTRLTYQISCLKSEVSVIPVSTEILECTTSAHSWSAATCQSSSMCSICGKLNGAPLAHTWEPATCTEAPYCSVCQKKEGSPLGHNVSDWTILQPENCGVDGIMTGVCATCSASIDQAISKTGLHTFTDWETILAPTCAAEGVQTRVCSVCQSTESQKTEMLSHNFAETIIAEATYHTAGTKGQVCSSCGLEGETTQYYAYYETSLKKMFDAYRANEISANEKFDDSYIAFTAKISSIEQGGLLSYGTIVFEVSNGAFLNDIVRCKIKSSEQLDYVKTLVSGNKVTIKGKVTSVMFYSDLGSNAFIDIFEIKKP